MITIRGAITIEKNEAEEIVSASSSLLERIIDNNQVDIDDIVFVIFTATKDIDKAYPAVAARNMGITQASLMCTQEMYVEGSLPMCIRVMVGVNGDKSQKDVVHCYMKNAKILRPDLKPVSIAIDGPTASGKSSISRAVAKKLGYSHVETGAMYRAAALYCIRNKIEEPSDIIDCLNKFQLEVELSENGQRTFLDGEDVTDEIRDERISIMSSRVAALDEVRQKLLPLQRKLAQEQSVIMDGRDIQTVVLPEATVKIFVTASIDERTKRRCIDLERQGKETNFEAIKRQIIERDTNDISRASCPLRKSEEAYEVDTSEMTFDESVLKVIEIIEQKLKGE